MPRGKQSTRRRRKRMLVPKARVSRSKMPSPESETSAASFFRHTLSPVDLFRRESLDRKSEVPGILDELLSAYDRHERWLIGQGHPPARLRDPKSTWPATVLPSYSDQIVRGQVELVHHATDALHRLQEQLHALCLDENPVSRNDVPHLLAEAFTAFLPVTRHPDTLEHLLKESLRVRFGGRTRAQDQRRALHARIALYQPRADALWRADPTLSKSEVARRIVAEGPVKGDTKSLAVRWLREHLAGPPTS